MKRSEIINQLLKEGFSTKTLLNFSDKQLTSLSNRINESLTVSDKTLETNPRVKNKVDNLSKERDVEIIPDEVSEGKGLKGKMPGLKAKVVKETGVPGLKAKVVKETGVPGLKAKEVKEAGVPGLKAKEVKETGVPGLKAKVVKETGVPGLKAKVVKETGVPGLKAKVVKEAAGAMPGLTVGGKKNIAKPVSKPGKEEGEENIDENDDNNDNNKTDDKKEGKTSKKQAFLDMIKKKKEEKSINEWVEKVAKKHFHPFTTKSSIMEMIADQMEEDEVEVEVDEQSPAPAVPKTRPGTKPGEKPGEKPRPKTPYHNPGPGTEPHPKAGVKVKTVKIPEFLKYKAIKQNVAETNLPMTKPGQEIKKLNTPPKK